MAKILHVDDETYVLAEVKAELEELGHEVTSAETLEKAKELFAVEKFDLVICDGSIPPHQLNGYRWAWELYHAGQRSMILSSDSKISDDHPDKVPRVKKTRTGRVEAIQRIIGS